MKGACFVLYGNIFGSEWAVHDLLWIILLLYIIAGVCNAFYFWFGCNIPQESGQAQVLPRAERAERRDAFKGGMWSRCTRVHKEADITWQQQQQ